MNRSSFLLALPLLALLTGCLGYKVGPTNGMEAGSRSIEIAPPVNHTMEPRITEAVSHAVRRRIQQDGTYRLNTKGDGDVIIKTTILRYHRQGLTFQPNDTLTVRDYRVQLFAQVNAYDRLTGKTLLNREVQGRTTVRVGSDQSSAERQAMPLLADDLAQTIVSLIVDGDW